MPDSARTIVLSYIWKHIHRITDEIDAGQHDDLYLKKVGRRMEEKDRNEIRSWRKHIKDDFVVINHVPHKGSVFVQVGRVAKFEQQMLGPNPIKDDSDIHDPRVFLIQGLATPLREMCEASHKGLMNAYPSLKKYNLPISFLHTTLLPYNNGITYGVIAEQHYCNYYETPQQYAEAVKIASDCYKILVLKNQETDNSMIPCKLYDTITPDIVRKAKPSTNISVQHEKWLRKEIRPDDYENDPEMTCLTVQGMIWMPFPNTDSVTDQRTMSVIQEITLSERPLKEVREGFKHRIKWEVWYNDHEPCPFHRQLGMNGGGVDALSFAECCKKDHLKRLAKARKRGEGLICSYWYNPVGEDEADYISRDPVARQQILNTLRIGPHDCSDVRLRVPLSYVDEVKWRMDNAQIFLPIIDSGVEYKWIYLGWVPVAVNMHAGLLSFGEITLNTETGDFAATAMTAERCAAMITRMKFVCSYGEQVGKGIPVEDISLIGTQMGKSKPDKAAMSRNVELLKEDFDINASIAIDKVSRRFRRCEYCGKAEEGNSSGKADDNGDDFKLLQCACKKYYYCSKEHQKLNWKDHKATCIKIREGTK